ncbi:hypothetical protein HG531_014043 [Fusarium graminearum]|nr:hypothetical protein HG531_014043 [Fusarium graminearum]
MYGTTFAGRSRTRLVNIKAVDAITQKASVLRICIAITVDDSAGLASGRPRFVFIGMSAMDIFLRVLTHLADLDVVISGNGGHGCEKTNEVNRRQAVTKDKGSRTDSDNFLENTGNREGDDRSALQQGELGGRHAKGNASGEK